MSPVWRDFIGERDQPLFGLHCKDSTISYSSSRGALVNFRRPFVSPISGLSYCLLGPGSPARGLLEGFFSL